MLRQMLILLIEALFDVGILSILEHNETLEDAINEQRYVADQCEAAAKHGTITEWHILLALQFKLLKFFVLLLLLSLGG